MICSVLFSGATYAGWYGTHNEWLNNSNCSTDGAPDAISPVVWGVTQVVQAYVVPGG